MEFLGSVREAEPERELWAAVVWQAMRDLASPSELLRSDALRWLNGPSFEAVASFAGLDGWQCRMIRDYVKALDAYDCIPIAPIPRLDALPKRPLKRDLRYIRDYPATTHHLP